MKRRVVLLTKLSMEDHQEFCEKSKVEEADYFDHSQVLHQFYQDEGVKIIPVFQGAVVFAGCLNIDKEGGNDLKKMNLKNLHAIQLNVTSDSDVSAAVEYVKKHLPPQGNSVLLLLLL